MKPFTFIARVWKWPGDMAWHFINIPRERYEKIRAQYPRGMVKVTTTIGKTSWDTALFPHSKTKSFIMPIKQLIRKKESIFAGEEVKIRIEFK
jgi:hypothetical protein